MSSGLTVNVYLRGHRISESAVKVTMAAVVARVLQLGLVDHQLGGRLVHSVHLISVGDLCAVLSPCDLSFCTGCREEQKGGGGGGGVNIKRLVLYSSD